jgi:hypothetical protein
MPANDQQDRHYDVCLSFASEQRDYVAEVAHLLRDNEVEVFYDSYETADLLGRDLIEHMSEIYGRRSRWCLLFASADYRRKVWPNLERAAAVDRALTDAKAYVVPVRFDETSIPGVRDSLGHVDARRTSPGELVAVMLRKLGRTADPPGVAACVLTVVGDRAPVDTETILRFALAQAGIRLPADHQSHVDGRSTVVVPLSVATELDVLTVLVPAIESVLDERVNGTLTGPTPALRIAVHRGMVPAVGDWDCYDTAFTTDMALAPAGAGLLRAAPRADSVVLVSHRVHEDLVRPARRGVDPAAYQQVELPRGAVGWARITGYAKPPGPHPPDSAEQKAKHTTNTFINSPVNQVGDVYGTVYHQHGGARD